MTSFPLLTIFVTVLILHSGFIQASSASSHVSERPSIDLAGAWQFALDPDNNGIARHGRDRDFTDTITLPGTTDTRKKGEANKKKDAGRLTRRYSYVGPAWYRRHVSIPKNWAGKQVSLHLERSKATELWVDGKRISGQNSLSAPHVYQLGADLKPGDHTICLRVDNSHKLFPVGGSHALSDHTQGNWNGIIGEIRLIAQDLVSLKKIKITPNIADQLAIVTVALKNDTKKTISGTLTLQATGQHGNKHSIPSQKFTFSCKPGDSQMDVTYKLGKDARVWDEFHSEFYQLSVALSASVAGKPCVDVLAVDFGLCDFKTRGTQFVVNGRVTYLRGKHDGCVFPLTGHPPMTDAGWVRYLGICKDYGFNHVRFHSWCPPEAAFRAADQLGIYLQPELPNWKSFKKDEPKHVDYMRIEGARIIQEYANHPSFSMFALGNEMGGERSIMADLVQGYRKLNGRPLYCQGSNNFFWDPAPQVGEDFFVSARVAKRQPGFVNDIRASFSFANDPDAGIINAQHPNTERTFESAVRQIGVPAIGHETGQYQVYPHFEEIDKYTGVMAPRNLRIFRKRLADKNRLSMADAYFKNSGAHAVNCYREDIEMSLRTPGFGGFQVLDLQDFPGQGSAYVGILDAFMDSKGLITPAQWRMFCADRTLQVKMPKYVWQTNEKFHGELILINYGPAAIRNKEALWKLTSQDGASVAQGKTMIKNAAQGAILSVLSIDIDLSKVRAPQRLTLRVTIPGEKLKNNYSIWVYPAKSAVVKSSAASAVMETESLTPKAVKSLNEGGRVWLRLQPKSISENSVGGLFINDYWSFPMFRNICKRGRKPVSPGTLGLLIDAQHPLFKQFPTATHSDWQWWSITKHSRPLILDALPGKLSPITGAIDNLERNHKLGLLFECRVGKGSLMVSSTDFAAANDAAARQYENAIRQHIQSSSFAPKVAVDLDQLRHLLNMKTKSGGKSKFDDSTDRTGGYDKL